MTLITVYPNHFGTDDFGQETKSEVSLERIADYQRAGKNGLDQKTLTAARLAIGDVDVYKEFKSTLPAAVFSGTYNVIPALNTELNQHSGLITVDFDDVGDIASLKATLAQMPEVRLAFISPSGQGVKAVVEVNPIPTNANEHRAAWEAVVEHLSQLEATVDVSGKDMRRLCYLAYDPQIHYRDTGPAVAWEMPDETEPVSKPYNGKVDISILKHLDADDYDIWLKVGMACKASDIGIDVWREWSETSDKYKAGDCEKKWKSFKGKGITWATIVKWAKKENPYFTDKGTFMPAVLAADLTDSYGMHFLSIPTEHYRRIYADGVYRLDTGMQLEKTVREILGDALWTPHHVSSVAKFVEIDSMIPLPPRGMQPCHHPNALNFKNGVLDLETMQLTPHSHEDVWIHQLPVTFDPQATCPTFDAWLHDIQEGRLQDIELAHEILGISLLQRVIFPQIYFLYGPTHTGKSTFLDVMTALLGEENISDVAFTDIGNKHDKFATASLVGKLANIDRDVTIETLTDTGTVKKVAGGELLSVQEKGKPRVSLRPYATIVMATNDMPKSRDWSDGWLSRMCILSFEKTHMDAPDRDMVQKLTTDAELSGILNHALAGLQRVVSTGQHTLSETTAANRKAYEEQNNAIVSWFNETFDMGDGRIPADDVEENYLLWSEREGRKALPKTKVREALDRMGIKRKRVRLDDGTRPFVYENLRIAADTDEDDNDDIEPTAHDVGF